MLSTSAPFLLVTRLNTTVVTVIPTDVPSWKDDKIINISATLLYGRTPASLFGKDRQLDSAHAEGKSWQ